MLGFSIKSGVGRPKGEPLGTRIYEKRGKMPVGRAIAGNGIRFAVGKIKIVKELPKAC